MKLKVQFGLFVSVLLASILAQAFLLKDVYPWVFVLAELLVVLFIALSVLVYQKISKRLNLISTGIHFLQSSDFNTRLALTGQKDIDQLLATYNSMMDRLRLERVSHKEKQSLLYNVIEASPTGILLLDASHQVKHVNAAAETLFGKKNTDTNGKRLDHILGTTIAEELALMTSGEDKVIALSGVQKVRFRKAHFIDQGLKTHFFLIEDLTHEMLAIEKNAFEKVIRMMAHEVNNSVGPVNSILRSIVDASEPIRQKNWSDYEKALTVAIERNSHLAHFMSNFSRVVKLPQRNPEKIILNELAEQIRLLFEPQLHSHSIQLELETCSAPVNIEADKLQMEQVLVNIVKNAQEAIGSNGIIQLITSQKPPQLRIRNNGKSILKEEQAQIFTPFYSTKKNGQGIGLMLIREVLSQHQFDFSLGTGADNWTEFTITMK